MNVLNSTESFSAASRMTGAHLKTRRTIQRLEVILVTGLDDIEVLVVEDDYPISSKTPQQSNPRFPPANVQTAVSDDGDRLLGIHNSQAIGSVLAGEPEERICRDRISP